jgi:hypothetical protein
VLRVAGTGSTGSTQPTACEQVTTEELRVTFPDQVRSAFFPVHIPMCARKGYLSLSVQAIQTRPVSPGIRCPDHARSRTTPRPDRGLGPRRKVT